jgi:hypothetical protein
MKKRNFYGFQHNDNFPDCTDTRMNGNALGKLAVFSNKKERDGWLGDKNAWFYREAVTRKEVRKLLQGYSKAKFDEISSGKCFEYSYANQ